MSDEVEHHKAELSDAISRVLHHGQELHRILARYNEEADLDQMDALLNKIADFSDNLRRGLVEDQIKRLDIPYGARLWVTVNGCVKDSSGTFHLIDTQIRSTLCDGIITIPRWGHSKLPVWYNARVMSRLSLMSRYPPKEGDPPLLELKSTTFSRVPWGRDAVWCQGCLARSKTTSPPRNADPYYVGILSSLGLPYVDLPSSYSY